MVGIPTPFTGDEKVAIIQGGSRVDVALAQFAQAMATRTADGVVANEAGGLPRSDSYLGVVSNRCMVADQINASFNSSVQRRWHIAQDAITALTLVFGNFYCSTTAEVAPGAARTVTADIEYPIGTFTRVTFGGANSGFLPDGIARFLSDAMPVTIPRGALFRVSTYQFSTAGILFSAGVTGYGALGDQGTFGTNIADPTGTIWAGTAGGNPWGPYAIIAQTRRPSVFVVGDSRAAGVGNTNNSVPYSGEIAPQIAPFMAITNLARGTMTAQQLASGQHAKRAEYMQYHTHGIMQIGINDISSGRTATQVIADRETIRASGAGLIWWGTTLGPKTTSTDAWATLANQTVFAQEAERVAFNDRVRAGVFGYEGFFDLADAFESSRNSGKNKAPPMTDAAITADGTHVNNAGYGLARPFVPIAFIRR